MDRQSNPVLEFLLILMGRKRLLLGILLLTTLVTAVVSLVMNKTFESRALIVPPEGGGNPLTAFLGDLPMSGLLAGTLPGGGGGDYFVAILNSRVMREKVLDRFDLREHYKMSESAKIEDVFKAMARRITAELDLETGMINLRAQDKDPVMARDIAAFMVDELEQLNLQYKTRRARNNRLFIEGEVLKIRASLDSLEGELVRFQEEQRVLEPFEQSKVILAEYAEIKAQAALKELELRLARIGLSAGHPKILMLESELQAIQQKLRESYEQGDSDLFLAVTQLPETTVEFLRHQRELEIENKKLAFMLPQLEQAKIEEVNDTEVLEVLDPPVVAEKRLRPKRTLMVIVADAVAFVLASLMILFLHRLERNPAFREQWTSLCGHLRSILRFKLD